MLDQQMINKLSDKNPAPQETKKKLSDEDQARVDAFTSTGYNDIERRPFRPLLLLVGLVIVLSVLSGVSLLIARLSGVI
ncbi:hypothetical protein NBRC116493_12770 [Aurantivibrio infirmus]